MKLVLTTMAGIIYLWQVMLRKAHKCNMINVVLLDKINAYGSRQSQLSLSNGALYIFNHAYEFANNYSRDWYYDKYGIESEPDHLSIIISDLPVDQSMNKILDVMITIDGGVKKIVYFP